MRQRAKCKFRNIDIEFDEIEQPPVRELGNKRAIPTESTFENCSRFEQNKCQEFGCILDPTARLGGAVPFNE